MACRVLGVLFIASLCNLPAISQEAASSPEVKVTTPANNPDTAGFPVKDQLTLSKCGGCHAPDANGNMTRISYIRTTPEGWEEAIKRMVRLNGLQLTPDEARSILRYLSDQHGLAPEENAKIAYFTEHRIIDEQIPSPDVAHACAACHALAKPLSWHRTLADWQYLENMHVAFFPSVRFTAFDHPHEHSDPGAPPAKGPTPAEQALEYIVKSSPLHTTEWADWQASMQAPRLAGRWLISGHEPGKGRFFGEMTIESGPDGQSFTTKTKISCNENSSVMTTSGKSLVYTGYNWRGRSTVEPAGVTSPETPQTVREVMALSKDQNQFTGRWFWGEYSEFGMHVTMRRATSAPMLIGVDRPSLKSGTNGVTLRIYGDALPTNLSAGDVDLGPGVKVDKILDQQPNAVTVSASVSPDAKPGNRMVTVKSASLPSAYAVYNHIDFLRVTPTTSIAHLGGAPHPKGYVQFETVAFSNGPDGKPNTADDIDLGPVPATYKMEEFVASYGDDDTGFVGAIDPKTGFFTPGSDGPDPKRRSMRNNYGDVWITATYDNMKARSYLVVAVPQYISWDQPEVAQ
jgi:quinohemoprotein amine dehydrogenase